MTPGVTYVQDLKPCAPCVTTRMVQLQSNMGSSPPAAGQMVGEGMKLTPIGAKGAFTIMGFFSFQKDVTTDQTLFSMTATGSDHVAVKLKLGDGCSSIACAKVHLEVDGEFDLSSSSGGGYISGSSGPTRTLGSPVREI